MQAKDHCLLGRYVLSQCGKEPDPICRRIFLLGCIEPDWNLITYIRGSIKYQFLHGHNADNARKHLKHLMKRLMKRGVCSPLQWFRFGAALHYLADSFTFAHNRCFAGSLTEHRLYEKLLHNVFADCLYTQKDEAPSADELTHERYLSERRSYYTDCRYIIGASMALSNKLSIQARSDDALVLTGAQNIYGKV